MMESRVYLIAVLIIGWHTSFSQINDSIKVFFIGDEPAGERFVVRLHGNDILKFKSRGAYKYSFYIPSGKKYGAPTGLNLLRRGRFGIAQRFIELNIHYETGFRYLVLIRDRTLKNKYAVRHEWTNEVPDKQGVIPNSEASRD